MREDKEQFLAKLAEGNPVDLAKVKSVSAQLAFLEKAGAFERPGEVVTRPLGRRMGAASDQQVVAAWLATKRRS
jgi:hypothetical protein